MSNSVDVFISQEDIAKRVSELGKQIRKEYGDEPITLLCILKGSYIFCADLMRAITGPVEIEFLKASSYGDDTESSGHVDLIYHFDKSITDKNLLIVEDIVDTGITLDNILESLSKREKPKSLKLVSLLSKPSRRKRDIDIHYLGFEIEDKFVIGYGLDYGQRYRELPFIGILNAD